MTMSPTMSALFILALRIIFVPFTSTEPDSGVPPVMCNFLPIAQALTHNMSVPEIPKRCQAIYYGAYFIDQEDDEATLNAISCLLAAGFPVYTAVADVSETPRWIDMMTTDKYDDIIETMATYMKDNNISGVVLDISQIIYNSTEPDLTGKVTVLINKVKSCNPDLKVGILLCANQHFIFDNQERFNFSVTNDLVDLYLIDTSSSLLMCDSNYSCEYGLLPAQHSDEASISIQIIGESAAASCLDKNKVFIFIAFYVGVTTDYFGQPPLEYPQYCAIMNEGSADSDNDTVYCPDSVQMYHDRAVEAKKYFYGLMMGNLDFDYWDDSCGCERYAITNAIIDGWEGK